MPYSEHHINKKASTAKRIREKGQLCPCNNCKDECTRSSKIVKRHLEVFGRYAGNDESGSSNEDESLDYFERDKYSSTVHVEQTDSSEDLHVNGKRARKDSSSSVSDSSEQSNSENIIEKNPVEVLSSDDDLESIVNCDLAALSDSESYESLLPSTRTDHDSSQSDGEIEEQQLEQDIYDSENAKIPLYEGSDITVLQALSNYFIWFTEHPSTSKTAFSDLLRLKKRLLPQPNNLPGSYDEAYSFVKQFLLPTECYHVCPNDCVIFRKTSKYDYSKLQSCPQPDCGAPRYWANKSARRRFIYFPLGPRWRRMYGNASISEVLQSHTRDLEQCEDCSVMHDVHDSPSWKQAFSEGGFSNGDARALLLQLSTDGVNPFSGNKVNYSMWPIMLTVLNLPRNVRHLFENIMLAGIIPAQTDGHEPKKLDPYLEIIVDEIIELSGTTFYDAFRNAPFTFKVALMNYVLDYPGLGKVFTTTGQTALQGCMWCEIRGKFITSLDKVVYLENRRYLGNDHPLRKSKSSFPYAKQEKRPKPEEANMNDILFDSVAHSRAKNKAQASNIAKATGSRGVNCFMLLPDHDRPNQAFPDMMHDLKNIVCTFFELITGKGDSVKVRKAEKELGRFKECWLLEKAVEDSRSGAECSTQTSRKQGKVKKQNNKLPAAPFRLSNADLKLADKRALNVRVPSSYGWKPCALFCKKPYLKSHDWKQLATDGILKFCLRGQLGRNQRISLFRLLDVLRKICSDTQDLQDLPDLEKEVNEVCAKLERDFPISVQTISLHILRHSVKGIQRQGPVHSWWMFFYERFNSWICQRVKNRRFPEATVMETYRLYDWVHFMKHSGRLLPLADTETAKAAPSNSKQYQLTEQEMGDLVSCGALSFPADQDSEQKVIKQAFAMEKQLQGKTSVLKSFTLDYGNVISSLVAVSYGGNTTKIGRISHFLTIDNKVSGKESVFVTMKLYRSQKQDPESLLYYVDTTLFDMRTVALACLSLPLVTAVDDENESLLWILNL